MSTIEIKKFTCSVSGANIKMELVYEVTFTETEARLDIGFSPDLMVTPGKDYLIAMGVNILGSLANFRKEVHFALPVVRSGGQPSVTRTATVEAEQSSFWISKPPGTVFTPAVKPMMELRLDISPDIRASQRTTISPIS